MDWHPLSTRKTLTSCPGSVDHYTLPVGPFNFVLDSAEVTADPKQILLYEQIAPDFFVFGSNGAGELVAFDLRGNSPPWPIVCFDGIASEESVERIADSLTGFVSLIGKA
ncbi:SMI1/KNR4 family protein [Pseudomonas syringae]|uniref:SMI1/KNR4 family protein n=1 Tax=Pseudomonas syringae TaxID=317 RepID=UPI003F756A96